MLSELYEPRDLASLAWSKQKQGALATLIDDITLGPPAPRVTLLHGPAGNGKLCTLKVVLGLMATKIAREAAAAAAAASNSSDGDTTSEEAEDCDSRPTASSVGGGGKRGPVRRGPKTEKGQRTAALMAALADASDYLSAQEAEASSVAGPLRGNNSTAAAAPATATAPSPPPLPAAPCNIRVLHSCQSSPTDYYHFLRQITATCRGEPNASAVAMEQRHTVGSSGGGSVPASRAVAASPSPPARSPPAAPVFNAFVVKFYGEPADHRLHLHTRVFMQEYEQLLAEAGPALWYAPSNRNNASTNSGNHGSLAAAARASALLQSMRHNLVFFLHTAHDTHSDKVDLGSAFPREVLESSALEQFHCTPVTDIAMAERINAVLAKEAARRWRALRPARGKKAAGTAGRSTAASSAVVQGPPGSLLMAPAVVTYVATASQGDLRQALLQIQWLTLLAPGMTEAEKRQSLLSSGGSESAAERERANAALMETVAAIYRHITSRTGALVKRSEADDRVFLAATAAPDDEEVGRGGATVKEEEQEDGGTDIDVSSDDDVVSISSGSSDSADSSTSLLSAGPAPKKRAAEVKAKKAPVAAAASGKGKAATAATTTTTSQAVGAKRKRSVLDLLEESPGGCDDDDELDSASRVTGEPPSSQSAGGSSLLAPPATQPSLKANRTEATDTRKATAGQGGSSARRVATGTAGGREHRTFVATVRDEYLGLSHATGRLLAQLYALSDVLAVMNVPPRKVLEYMTNNMQHYFAEGQMGDYEACAAAGSAADALRTMEGMGGGGAQFRRNALDAKVRGAGGGASNRTAGDENATGIAEQQLDIMALTVFDAAYRTYHRKVHTPRGFTAQRPPPFHRPAYPRVRTVNTNSYRRFPNRGGVDGVDGVGGGGAVDEMEARTQRRVSEEEMGEEFLGRLDRSEVLTTTTYAGPSPAVQALSRLPGDETDMLREGLPGYLEACGRLETVLLEYAPYAQFIVLDKALLPPRHQQRQRGTTYNSAAAPAALAPFDVFTMSSSQSLSSSPHAAATQPPTPPQQQLQQFFSSSSIPSTTSSQVAAAGPKRTVFKFSAAAAAPATQPHPPGRQPTATPPAVVAPQHRHQRRPCTELQYRLLKRGLPVSVAMREAEFFSVSNEVSPQARVMHTDGRGRGSAGIYTVTEGSGAGGFGRPLLPDGDVIEDYSD